MIFVTIEATVSVYEMVGPELAEERMGILCALSMLDTDNNIIERNESLIARSLPCADKLAT